MTDTAEIGVTYRRLTPEDCTFTHDGRTFPFREDEDGTWAFGYGHVPADEFAAAVNEWDERYGSPADWTIRADSVVHAYAKVNDEPDGWVKICDPTDPLAAPITYVER